MSALLLMTLLAASPNTPTVETTRPYDVAICLRFTDSPQLTPLFRESLRRQLEGHLTSFFAGLADVSILTEGHWLIDEFPGRAIVDPAASDELWSRLPHDKTVIVRIDFRDEQYQVEWRELDRERHLESPVFHHTTPDRQWLAKAVCLAAKEHVALVAEVMPGTLKETTAIRFRGDKHAGPLMELLGPSAILQPYWIIARRDGSRLRYPIPGTLLRVRAGESISKAQVLSNLSDPWKKTASVVAFEAVRVSTQAGRVRLRLVDAASGDPVIQCSVFVNDEGLDRFQSGDNLGSPDREGVVLVPRPLRDVAFVKVSQGSASVLQIPLPITSDFSEHEIKVPVESVPGKRMEFDRRMRFLIQDVQTLAAMQADAFRDVNSLNAEKRYEDALSRAQATAKAVTPLLSDSKSRFTEAKSSVADLQMNDSRIAWLESQLAQISTQHNSLNQTAANLREAIDTREAGKRAKVLLDLAQQAETQGDIDEALARYELALNELEQPDVRKRVESIRKLWDVTDSQPRRLAHEMIYNTWANAELTDLSTLLPQVKRAFETLKANDDYLRGWKLINATDDHLGDLTSLIDQLASRVQGDDAAELQRYQDLTQEMATFQEEVVQFVTSAAEGNAAQVNPPANNPTPPATNEAPAAPKSPLDTEEEEPLP